MDPEAPSAPLLPQPDGFAALPKTQQDHWTRVWARQCYTSLSNIALALFFGIVTAFTLKEVGQTIAIAVVLLFIGFQILAYYGFVNFNWQQVGGVLRSHAGLLDINRDGRLDYKDVGAACSRITTWAFSWGVPSVLGFSAGFWLGWRKL